MGAVRKGCLGCTVVIGALIVILALSVVMTWMQSRHAQPVTEVLTPELPMGPGASEVGAAPEELVPLPPPGRPLSAGDVRLDVSQGELVVRPAGPGERLRVEATYDADLNTLDEALSVDESGTWRYDVTFSSDGGGLRTWLRYAFSGRTPRVTVYLPADVPLDVDVDVAQGGGDVELGGLWLREARIEATQGGLDLDFSEPLREPMGELRIQARMGGLSARRLGNASPSRLEVSSRMGGADVDLGGRWRGDAEVRVRTSMGGAGVALPEDVNVVGVPGHGREDLEAPTLTLEVDASMGEVELRRAR